MPWLLLFLFLKITIARDGKQVPRGFDELDAERTAVFGDHTFPPQLRDDLLDLPTKRNCEKLCLEILLTFDATERLVVAIRGDNEDAFYTILKHTSPAELNRQLPGYGGETLLTYTLKSSPDRIALKYIAPLVKAGAILFLPNEAQKTPALLALETRDTLVTEFILQILTHNYPQFLVAQYLSLRDIDGKTPLWVAISTRQLRYAHILLRLGVKANSRSQSGAFQPLHAAVRGADVGLVQKLLDSGAEVGALDDNGLDVLSVALDLRRHVFIELISKSLRNSWFQYERLLQPWTLEMAQSSDNMMRLFNAIRSHMPDQIIEPLIRFAAASPLPLLCTVVNSEGRSLLHEAILCTRTGIVLQLLEYYTRATQNPLWASLCYADRPDRFQRHPSESLLETRGWLVQNRTPILLDYLFSNPDPATGENCFHRAIGFSTVERVFFLTGAAAVERYGAQVLHLDLQNKLGMDVLRKAVHWKVSGAILSLLANWLHHGSHTYSPYGNILLLGLQTAATGWYSNNSDLTELIPHPPAVRTIGENAPVAIHDMLHTYHVITSSDEKLFRALLNVYPGPYPPTRESPLSQAVISLLSPLNMIPTPQLIKEMTSDRNLQRYRPVHFGYALDWAGSTFNLPIVCHASDLSTYVHLTAAYLNPDRKRSSVSSIKYVAKRLHRYGMVLWTKINNGIRSTIKNTSYDTPDSEIIYPILGSETLFHLKSELKSACSVPPSISARTFIAKRARIIYFLLTSPLAAINTRIARVSAIVFLISSETILCVLISCFLLTRYGKIGSLQYITDMIPHPKSSWITAAIEGARRAVLFPSFPCRYRVGWQGYNRLDLFFFVISIMRHLSLLWLIFEKIDVCTTYPGRHDTSSSIEIRYSRSLLYAFAASFLIHTTIARKTSKESAEWIRIMVFGWREKDTVQHDDAQDILTYEDTDIPAGFQWLPASQRLDVAHFRAQTSLLRRRSSYPLTSRKGIFNLHQNSSLPQISAMEGTTTAKQLSRGVIVKNGISRRRKQFRLKHNVKPLAFNDIEAERKMLGAALTEFGRVWEHQSLFWDMVLVIIPCFIVAQYPFWRVFRSLRLLYYDVFLSNAKYLAYTEPKTSATPAFRETILLIAYWNILLQLTSPILLALRLMDVMGRAATGLQNRFPLRNVKMQLTSFQLEKNRWWKIGTLKTYIDVRQTIFKQFAFVWDSLRLGLTILVVCGSLVLLYSLRYFHSGQLAFLYFIPHVFYTGLQSLLLLFLFNVMAVRGALANSAASHGWKEIQSLYVLPPTDCMDKESKRLEFEAVKFFKSTEFRFDVVGILLSAKTATILGLFSIYIILQMTIHEDAT